MAADASDGPVLRVVSKRLRALRKKYSRITQMENSVAAGKTLNREQEELLRSKPVVTALIDELERLRSPLDSSSAAPAAASCSDSDSSVQDLLALVYFGSLFDVKQQSDFESLVHTRKFERDSCLTYGYVGDDREDSLAETDLNAVAALASLAASRHPGAAGVSHRDALQACACHGRLFLRCADEPIHPDSTITYAGVRGKLDRIMASGYYTAQQEMTPLDLAAAVASFEAGSVQVQGSMVVSPQSPEAVEKDPAVEEHKVVSPRSPKAVEESHVVEGLKETLKKLFLSDDDTEIRETFRNYIYPDESAFPVAEKSVAGDERTYPERTGRARRGTAALAHWFCDLLDEGYVLDTTVTIDDFSVDQLGRLRANKYLLDKITNIMTAEKVRDNMAGAAVIIKTDIHSNLSIPHDLCHLLDILDAYTIDYSPLVRNHVSHIEGDGKTALYIKLFSRLKAMAKLDPSVYANVLKHLGKMPEVSGWRESAMQNIHLHAVLRFSLGVPNKPDPKKGLTCVLDAFLGAQVHYDGHISGLMDFRRNSQSHLEGDYSVDEVGYLEAGMYGAVEAFRIFHEKEKQRLQLKHQTQQENLQGQHQLKQGQKQEEQGRQEWLLQQEHQEQAQKQRDEHQEQRDQPQQPQQRWQDRKRELPALLQRQQQQREMLEQKQRREEKRLQKKHRNDWKNLLWRQQQDQKKQQKQQQEELDKKLREPISGICFLHLAYALGSFLSRKRSAEAAKAGALAIVRYIDSCSPSTDQAVQWSQALDAIVQGEAEAAAISQGAAAQSTPSSMFRANDISDMLNIISPNLLAEFQKAMFDQGEDFCLGDDVMVPKLT